MTEQMIETGADVFGRPVAWATVERTGEQSALFATRGTGVPGVMFDGIGQADPLDEHGSWCGTPCGRPNHPVRAAVWCGACGLLLADAGRFRCPAMSTGVHQPTTTEPVNQ